MDLFFFSFFSPIDVLISLCRQWILFFTFPSHEWLCNDFVFSFIQTGPKDLTEQSLGVNYRALSDLFHLSAQRRDTFCYDVAVQMIEIYNEQVRDLLVTDGLNRRYPL